MMIPNQTVQRCPPEEIVVDGSHLGSLVLSRRRRGIYRVDLTARGAVGASMVLGISSALVVAWQLRSGHVPYTTLGALMTLVLVTAVAALFLLSLISVWPDHVVDKHLLYGIDVSRPSEDVQKALRCAPTARSTRDVLAVLSGVDIDEHQWEYALHRLDALCARALLDEIDPI